MDGFSDIESSSSDVGSEVNEVETPDADFGDGDGVNDFDDTYESMNNGDETMEYSQETPENQEPVENNNEDTDTAVDEQLNDFDDVDESAETTETPEATPAGDNVEQTPSDMTTDENVDDALSDFEGDDESDEADTETTTDETGDANADGAQVETGDANADDVQDETRDADADGAQDEAGDADVDGTQDETGDADADGTQDETGDASADGTQDEAGDADVDGTQDETGDASADGTQDETGDASADGAQDEAGDADSDGTQDETGDASADGTQDEAGDANVDGTQDETGDANADGAQDETGDINADGAQDETGDADADGTQDEAGDANADGTQDETGDASTDGAQDEAGEADVDGTQDEAGEADVDGTQDEAGEADADGTQDEAGEADADGTQDEAGDANADGAQDETGDINADGTQDEAGDADADGTQDETENANADGTQDETGNANVDGAQDETGNANVDGAQDETGDANADGTQDEAGDADVDGTQDETGNANVDGAQDETGDTNVDGTESGSNIDGTNDGNNDGTTSNGDVSERDHTEKNAVFENVSYHQGQNDLGALGTCGPTSIANSLNRVTGSTEYTENKVLHNAMDNNLCHKSDNPYSCGGTTTRDVVNIIDNVKNPDDHIHTEVYEYDKALSVEDLANRLDDPGTVAMVGVDSATLWDQRGDVACSGLFQHTDSPSDHWITVDSPIRDEAGNLTGFNVIDSGGGVSEVSREKFEAMYMGDAGHTVSDPTAVIISNNGDAGSSYSAPEGLERTSNYKGSAEVSDGNDPPHEVGSITLANTEKTASGLELSPEQSEVNQYFRGDQFSKDNTFESSLDASAKKDLIDANNATTCGLNENLNGSFQDNTKYSSATSPEKVSQLNELRSNVSEVTEDTVMQKVITPEQFADYTKESAPRTDVSGCASKASDVAPYTNNIEQAYETLRLDYEGTVYKDLAENNGDMYVMRFTSDYCPSNTDYPKMDGSEPWNKPPCTGTGFTGSGEHMVPEYTYGRGQEITDGAIYKVDSEGNETMVAFWNHGHFEKID